jgi:hypothetical protein
MRRWARHVERMGMIRNAYNILAGWEYNIRMDLREIA